MDRLDALWLISVIDDRGIALAHEDDQRFLDALADELQEGRPAPLTAEEQSMLCLCATEVGLLWVPDWIIATVLHQ